MTRPLADILLDTAAGSRRLRAVSTQRSDGDVHPSHATPGELERRQITATGRPWTMLDQRHGIDVLEAPASGVGDVGFTTDPDTDIAVWAADCAPRVLGADDGTLVAAHGGWRGLAAGVVDAAVTTARQGGGDVAVALLGPVIGPCCYEFGGDDLATIPDAVTSRTAAGAAALDVPATIAAMLRRHDIELRFTETCTGCDDRWFSHRVRAEPSRHAVVAWWERADD
ncbi:MAG: polyphenol oxidase family protein [Ilumatobacter sp.]